jgi:hypothetical protein
VFIPAFPGTDYYAGFAHRSIELPSPEANAGVVRQSVLARDLIALTSDDERHPKGEKNVLYFSALYAEFRGVAWTYKCAFNQAMLAHLNSEAHKAPEPTPTAVTPPAVQETRQP